MVVQLLPIKQFINVMKVECPRAIISGAPAINHTSVGIFYVLQTSYISPLTTHLHLNTQIPHTTKIMVRYVQTSVVEQDFRSSDSHDIDYESLFLPQNVFVVPISIAMNEQKMCEFHFSNINFSEQFKIQFFNFFDRHDNIIKCTDIILIP